jgi:hypothetical protein
VRLAVLCYQNVEIARPPAARSTKWSPYDQNVEPVATRAASSTSWSCGACRTSHFLQCTAGRPTFFMHAVQNVARLAAGLTIATFCMPRDRRGSACSLPAPQLPFARARHPHPRSLPEP